MLNSNLPGSIPLPQANSFMNFAQFFLPDISSHSQSNQFNSLSRSLTIQEDRVMVEEKQQLNIQKESEQTSRIENETQNDAPNRSKQRFNKESAFVKISVYKQHQLANKKIYILQDDKIIGSSQTQKNEIQIIRRRKQQQTGESNIDLGLTSQDSSLDKVPSKISTEFGFRYSSHITPEIFTFLSLKYFHNEFNRLPINVFKLIHQFLKPQPRFYIQDCGTSLKTFVRIQKEQPKEMVEFNNYLIGSDFYFHVLHKSCTPKQEKKSAKKLTEAEQIDYFYQTLVREHERYRSRVHGLTVQECETFQKYLTEYQSLKKKGRKQYILQNCNRPFIKIQFDTPMQKQIVVFIARYGEEQSFKIGRSQDCDIVVNVNTVSRRQTLITFSNNQWTIRDGEGIKASANGTWQALQNYEYPALNKTEKMSQPLFIEDKMEIKISENIFKFDLVNFGIYKRKKLTGDLYEEITNQN